MYTRPNNLSRIETAVQLKSSELCHQKSANKITRVTLHRACDWLNCISELGLNVFSTESLNLERGIKSAPHVVVECKRGSMASVGDAVNVVNSANAACDQEAVVLLL